MWPFRAQDQLEARPRPCQHRDVDTHMGTHGIYYSHQARPLRLGSPAHPQPDCSLWTPCSVSGSSHTCWSEPLPLHFPPWGFRNLAHPIAPCRWLAMAHLSLHLARVHSAPGRLLGPGCSWVWSPLLCTKVACVHVCPAPDPVCPVVLCLAGRANTSHPDHQIWAPGVGEKHLRIK